MSVDLERFHSLQAIMDARLQMEKSIALEGRENQEVKSRLIEIEKYINLFHELILMYDVLATKFYSKKNTLENPTKEDVKLAMHICSLNQNIDNLNNTIYNLLK